MLTNYCRNRFLLKRSTFCNVRSLLNTCAQIESTDLTLQVKHSIDNHWKDKLDKNEFDSYSNQEDKFYVLSMFPYPSGNLHMGHVRVYTISDVMARFYRMNGKNVLHPIGFDAFGLPAENAALQNNVPAQKWTQINIMKMRQQLRDLGCSFDWNREIATCDSTYYKWTQWLFLKLYEAGLVYQKEALVNWDPIDKTVLADEQVDNMGCSWRSGAKVEKKLLKQWFIRTTKFAKQLYDGLTDPTLTDWRDIINLQKHWIGDCNGYTFDFNLLYNNTINQDELKPRTITIWTDKPELLENVEFIGIRSNHILNQICRSCNDLLDVKIINPFKFNKSLPIIRIDDENIEFAKDCDTYLGTPVINSVDMDIANKYKIIYDQVVANDDDVVRREKILKRARKLNIGGYLVSAKLKDWLISRQRYWGTPIPVIHCPSCGTVPVPEKDLPIILPVLDKSFSDTSTNRNVLHDHEAWLKTSCPKCGDSNCRRESDTMDTFVDSSWYFLRYLDANNENKIFQEDLANKLMPVDLYVGGKEHAVLHLYYARFINHFLHSIGLVPQSEPFKRLLVQGMIMGRSYRLKSTSKYLQEKDVTILDVKKNEALETKSGQPVVMQWEKMSKSKLNGVDPSELFNQYGIDTIRLIILGDVAPTSHRNWTTDTFPGIINWQNRLWLTLRDFKMYRSNTSLQINPDIVQTSQFIENENKLFDARNFYLKGVTFNYKFSHQLSVAISKMQGLTNSIRKAPKEVIKYGKQYERALATQIILLAPMAPHFASELWTHFIEAENRVNTDIVDDFNWNLNVLKQKWPQIDKEYNLDLIIKVNGADIETIKYEKSILNSITFEDAMKTAETYESVNYFLRNGKIIKTKFLSYPNCMAILEIYAEKFGKKTKTVAAL